MKTRTEPKARDGNCDALRGEVRNALGLLTGKWKLSFTTPQGQEEATADLAMQPDGTLTGSVVSDHGATIKRCNQIGRLI